MHRSTPNGLRSGPPHTPSHPTTPLNSLPPSTHPLWHVQINPDRREIRPTADRGPILLCVDTSGSMRGARETVAKVGHSGWGWWVWVVVVGAGVGVIVGMVGVGVWVWVGPSGEWLPLVGRLLYPGSRETVAKASKRLRACALRTCGGHPAPLLDCCVLPGRAL